MSSMKTSTVTSRIAMLQFAFGFLVQGQKLLSIYTNKESLLYIKFGHLKRQHVQG